MKIQKLGFMLLVAMIGSTLVFSSPGFANYGKKSGDYQHKRLDEKVLFKAHLMKAHQDELGLSDDQVGQIIALKIDVMKYLVRQGAEIEVIAIDIKSMLYNRPVDTAAIHKLIDNKYDLKKAKSKYLVDSYAKLKGILSDEQYDKMKSLKKGMYKHGR